MEIPRCESLMLPLSWGFLELVKCLWNMSLCICPALVLFAMHVLVTCLHGHLPEFVWIFLCCQGDLAATGVGY